LFGRSSADPRLRTEMSAVLNAIGAPRPMKMGTIASPWRYDIVA
jgi:hypothetical protein